MRKNYIALVMMVLLFILALTGCTGKSDAVDVTGTYPFYAVDEGDGYISKDIMIEVLGEEVGAFFADYSMVLEKGGKGNMTMDSTHDITWTLDKDKITLTAEGESIEGTYKNGVIELEMDGMKLVFAREGADTSGMKLLTKEEAMSVLGQ